MGRETIRLKDEHSDYLAKKDNKSAYVRRLVDADMRGHDVDLVGLQIQIETLEKQAQEAAERERMYQERAEELRQLRDDLERSDRAELEDVLAELNVEPDPANPAIKEQAKRLDITPAELADELAQHSTV